MSAEVETKDAFHEHDLLQSYAHRFWKPAADRRMLEADIRGRVKGKSLEVNEVCPWPSDAYVTNFP